MSAPDNEGGVDDTSVALALGGASDALQRRAEAEKARQAEIDKATDPESFARMLPELGPCPRCARPLCVFKGGKGRSRQCEFCERADLERESRARKVATGNHSIPDGYAWADFDLAELPAGPALVQRAREAIEHGIRGAVFVGHSSLGKTSLAIAMMRAWMARSGQTAIFVHAHRLGKARAQHRLGKGEAEEVDLSLSAPLLLIDELRDDRFTSSSAVYDVVQERHADGLPTWVTTGLGANAKEAHARIVEIYGDGTARRLFEGARVFDFSKRGVAAPPPQPERVRDSKKLAAGDDT